MKQANISIKDPEQVEQALNVLTVLMGAVLFVRGVGVHAGFAVFMAVVVPSLLRLSLGLLVRWEYGMEGYVEGYIDDFEQ